MNINSRIVEYAIENNICDFYSIFKSIKNKYRKHYRDLMLDGSWYLMGKHPNVKGPLHIVMSQLTRITDTGWFVASDKYHLEINGSLSGDDIGLLLFVYIKNEKQIYLAWNSDDCIPKVKFAIKNKELKKEIYERFIQK